MLPDKTRQQIVYLDYCHCGNYTLLNGTFPLKAHLPFTEARRRTMGGINVHYSLLHENDLRFLHLKVMDVLWKETDQSNLFGEIAENLLKTSYNHICFDLSSLRLVSSLVFGICMNIVSAAKEENKVIKFRFNKDAAETARVASMDKLVQIEECA
jgi:hypothetical protein